MRKKVLIIDDEPGISKLLKINLEQNLFAADINGNGRAGLMKALNINYDLILLSVRIDGFQILKKLRERKSTPVIMLSAQDDEKVSSFFLNSGADDYVVKPFNCRGVVERVKKLIN